MLLPTAEGLRVVTMEALLQCAAAWTLEGHPAVVTRSVFADVARNGMRIDCGELAKWH